ncbi:MAG: hypothetical protein I3270_01005 [Candidatus Moeniiplasma glomeromycotorum]|nr:hypothetical protein [Candidatus Moeniiplasma glomeromycotorum]MCE8162289.1 hypothetical protein [Candidatus Moeniiplasma glomeromycotorum]MCE8166214.1 hypothetical protein [Candidatus Moeniiplasma glomeromycotorum]MCE8166695.1 hypothetical protein [Candidatus Moeniiplasma glomeromycotorum]
MRTESKNWKLIENKEIFDFSSFNNYLKGYLIAKTSSSETSSSESYIRCEDCGSHIKEEGDWKAFQLKSEVNRVESGGKAGYRLTNPIIEFYCSNCQIAEGEKGGGDDTPPQIQAKNRTSLIENKSEEKEEGEKDELSESSEQGKLFKRVNNLREAIEVITTLLEQLEERKKLLKESSDQQENKKIEEEINKLKKEHNQKKQELEELEKQLNFVVEKK